MIYCIEHIGCMCGVNVWWWRTVLASGAVKDVTVLWKCINDVLFVCTCRSSGISEQRDVLQPQSSRHADAASNSNSAADHSTASTDPAPDSNVSDKFINLTVEKIFHTMSEFPISFLYTCFYFTSHILQN